jgi:hypothetical protein
VNFVIQFACVVAAHAHSGDVVIETVRDPPLPLTTSAGACNDSSHF